MNAITKYTPEEIETIKASLQDMKDNQEDVLLEDLNQDNIDELVLLINILEEELMKQKRKEFILNGPVLLEDLDDTELFDMMEKLISIAEALTEIAVTGEVK